RNWFLLRRMIPRFESGSIVHAFGLKVLRRLRAATLGVQGPRIVLTLTGRERLTWIDRRCLRVVSRVLVPHAAAAEAVVRQGVPRGTVAVVPPAVSEALPPPDRSDFCRAHDLPADATLVMTAGRIETQASLFPAVWAFEFVRFIDQRVHLLVIGNGPGREAM